MRYVPSGNPFMAKDPWPGATDQARRSLAQLNIESPHVARLLAVCKGAKLKVVSPIWSNDAVGHVGIPSKKVVLIHSGFKNSRALDKFRVKWDKEGWGMLSITSASMDRFSDEDLSQHLAAAIKEVGK